VQWRLSLGSTVTVRVSTYALAPTIVSSAASRELQPKRIVSVPEPGFASSDHTRLDTRLHTYGLKEKKVRGDGNCQFRALADQLFRDQAGLWRSRVWGIGYRVEGLGSGV